jgi:hypothetical protein
MRLFDVAVLEIQDDGTIVRVDVPDQNARMVGSLQDHIWELLVHL